MTTAKRNALKMTTGETRRIFIVLALIAALLLAGTIGAYLYSGGQTDIFKSAEYGKGEQNSKVYVSDKLGLTFLGTYSNSISAYDKKGDRIWTQNVGGAVSAMEYDLEKDWLLVGSQDRNIYVYNAADGTLLNTYSFKGKIYDMDLDQATGRLLVSHGVKANKHYIGIIDVSTGEELMNLNLKSLMRSVKFTADKSAIIQGDARGRVTLTDFEGKKIEEVKMRGVVYDLCVLPESGDVFVVDERGYVGRFSSDLKEEKFKVSLVGEGRAVGVSADGQWIATGTREGDIYILNGEGETQYTTLTGNEVSDVYFGESNAFIATLSENVYEFDQGALSSVGSMDILHKISFWAIFVFAAAALVLLATAFPYTRDLEMRFWYAVWHYRTAYLMLAPSIILILIFHYYNIFQALYYAFTDWSLATRTMREVNFIGFDNFVKMINEGYFLLGVKNMLIIMVSSFAKLLTVPILLAEIVFAMRTRTGASSRRRYWFRLLLVVPMVVPGVVGTLMWKNIYDPNVGALNSILGVIGLPQLQHSWLGDPKTALGAIIFMGFPWINSFAFLVFYGALINIPEDLFEAAKVDGSNAFWNFFKIHLPLITPQLKMLIITTFISSVQDYGGILLLTSGGPGTSTYVPGLELYLNATKLGQYGYACAMGLVMFVVILIGSMFNLRMKTQELN